MIESGKERRLMINLNNTDNSFSIRRAEFGDLPDLLNLYTHLHNTPVPVIDNRVEEVWRNIIGDGNQHILLGITDGKPVSSCVLVIVSNLTHMQHPYALIENVVTHADYRGRGYATRMLDAAADIAVSRGCYKIMLMTGSKQESTYNFYRSAGYNSADKTAFVRWL
jgi:ribosomal protein S18 acetylase RimI-like enzyme